MCACASAQSLRLFGCLSNESCIYSLTYVLLRVLTLCLSFFSFSLSFSMTRLFTLFTLLLFPFATENKRVPVSPSSGRVRVLERPDPFSSSCCANEQKSYKNGRTRVRSHRQAGQFSFCSCQCVFFLFLSLSLRAVSLCMRLSPCGAREGDMHL